MSSVKLLELFVRQIPPESWSEGDNIPWNDPGFSRRMLREHLTQSHDLASRRSEKINEQVDWIHREILSAKPTEILDLCCGPACTPADWQGLGIAV